MASLVNVTALVYFLRECSLFIYFFARRTQKESQPHVHVSAIIYYLIFECSYVYGTSLHQLIQSFWLSIKLQATGSCQAKLQEKINKLYTTIFLLHLLSPS